MVLALKKSLDYRELPLSHSALGARSTCARALKSSHLPSWWLGELGERPSRSQAFIRLNIRDSYLSVVDGGGGATVVRVCHSVQAELVVVVGVVAVCIFVVVVVVEELEECRMLSQALRRIDPLACRPYLCEW